MSVLATFLNTFRYLGAFKDDDPTDRLNYFHTPNLLVALSVLVSFKQFGGDPVECLIPDMFPGAWEQYAEQYCWSQDTYYESIDDGPAADIEKRMSKRLSYYQWVPFFLLFQALCFRLPSLVWKYLAGHSGIKIHDIVGLATDPQNVKPDAKQANVRALTTHLQGALRFHRRLSKRQVTPHQCFRPLNLPYSANYVTFLYVVTKLLYFANVLFQMYLMNRFMQTDRYSFYGFGALRDIMNGTEWESTGVFPRVTFCDFRVRVMGNNVQRYSVQCVLVINIFNEKIFVFLWFWFMLLIILTLISLLYWLAIMLLPTMSENYISSHLELSELPFDKYTSAREVQRFVKKYLRRDGIFVLRMITLHAGVIFGTDLILSLYRAFYGIEENVKRQLSNGPNDLTPSPSAPPGYDDDDDENRKGFFGKLRLRGPGGKNKGLKRGKPVVENEYESDQKELMEILLPGGEKAFIIRKAPQANKSHSNSAATGLSSLDETDSRKGARRAKTVGSPEGLAARVSSDDQKELVSFSENETLPAAAKSRPARPPVLPKPVMAGAAARHPIAQSKSESQHRDSSDEESDYEVNRRGATEIV